MYIEYVCNVNVKTNCMLAAKCLCQNTNMLMFSRYRNVISLANIWTKAREQVKVIFAGATNGIMDTCIKFHGYPAYICQDQASRNRSVCCNWVSPGLKSEATAKKP